MTNSQKHVLDLILKSEGGLNEDEPAHVGGVSYAGITQQAYDGWRKDNINLPATVHGLKDRHDIVESFYVDYFSKYHVWEVPECLQYIFADFVVNAGGAAVKIIQRLASVDDDGVWGSGTSAAVATWKNDFQSKLESDTTLDDELITTFHEQKLKHYNTLAEKNPEKYARYLPGWKRRANKVLADLNDLYFKDDEPTLKAVDEDDPELQETFSEQPTPTPTDDRLSAQVEALAHGVERLEKAIDNQSEMLAKILESVNGKRRFGK